MSPYGYEQTLDRSRREVRFPLESGRECRHIREPRVLGPVTAQKRTAETISLDVPAPIYPGIGTKAETGVRNSWYRARDLNLRQFPDTPNKFPDMRI